MTIQKVLAVCKQSIDAFIGMFDVCVISIDGVVSISLSELLIASIIAFFVIRIAVAFSFNN